MRQAILYIAVIVLVLPSVAYAGGKRVKPEEEGKKKRPYVHACPAGTEQVGDAPPAETTVFCRQPLPKGGYRLEGTLSTFYRNGKKRLEGDYLLGEKSGTWKTFWRNGEVRQEQTWQNGKLVETKNFNKAGEKVEPKKREVAKTEAGAEDPSVRKQGRSDIRSALREAREGNQKKRRARTNFGWPGK